MTVVDIREIFQLTYPFHRNFFISIVYTHALSESIGRMQVNNHHAVKAMSLPVEVICGLETDTCTEVVKRGVCAVELSSVTLTGHE